MKKGLYIFLTILFASNFFITKSDSFVDKKEAAQKATHFNTKPPANTIQKKKSKKTNTINYSQQLTNINKALKKQNILSDYIKLDDEKTKSLRHLMKSGSAEEIIEFYKINNFDINASLHSTRQQPVFHYLVLTDLKTAKNLYDYGEIDIKKSPALLSAATAKNSIETVKFLLDIGYNPDGFDKNNQSPFLRSILFNKLDISYLLESRGADITSKYIGKNAIDWAVISKFSKPETLNYLLERGFKINKKHVLESAKYGRTTILKHLISKRPELRYVKSSKKNLMDIAVESGDIDMIKYLNSIGFQLEKKHINIAELRFKNAFTTYDKFSTIIQKDKKAEEVYSFVINNT